MRKLAVIAFTGQGCALCREVTERLAAAGLDAVGYAAKEEYLLPGLRPVSEGMWGWTEEMFQTKEALLFIGACGIAVRSIAPFLHSKWEDPAVLVMDEARNYVIPLLSGHVGGANALALTVSGLTGAVPVLTTATDVRKVFAVDVFAAANGLKILDRELAREASARVLKGEHLAFYSELPAEGTLPEELYKVTEKGQLCADAVVQQEQEEFPSFGICIAKEKKPVARRVLQLYPAQLCVGIGCRRQTPKEALAAFVREVVEKAGFSMRDVRGLYSLDRKASEPGLLAFAREEGLAFHCYTVPELLAAEGSFTASAFVEEITGVDNVCERAAVVGSGGGELLVKKQARSGMTAAAALGRQGIRFD